MTLVEALASQVSSKSRTRGAQYFQAGAVRSLTSEHGVMHASVRGSSDYDVWIEAQGTLIRASCNCPYFDDRLDLCKHIWAAILAAVQQQMPLVPLGTRPEEVSLEPAPPDDAFDDLHFTPSPLPRRREPRAQPAWRQLLDTIDALPGGAAPSQAARSIEAGQLLYVVDTAASLRNNSLVLMLMTRDRKRNGEWGKARAARISSLDIDTHPSPAERQALERLAGGRPYYNAASDWNYAIDLSQLQLRGAPVTDLVPQLCALGTCMLRTEVDPRVRLKPDTTYGVENDSGHNPRAAITAALERRARTLAPKPEIVYHSIEWDDGPPWTFRMAVERVKTDAGYRIDGWLERGSERMSLATPLLMLSDGIVFTETHAARLDAESAFTWLVALQRSGPIVIPADGRDRLLDSLLPSSLPLASLPDDLRIDIADVTPRPRLRLHPDRFRVDRLRVELTFEYEGTVVVPDPSARLIRQPGQAGSTRAIRRDSGAEARAMTALRQLGCRLEWDADSRSQQPHLAASQMPGVVRTLLGEGWHVEARGRIFRRPGSATMNVTSGIDWFELHGHVDYGGAQATLPALLDALASGTGYVALNDGTTGLLPEDWLRRYAPLARLGTASGDHMRFKLTQSMLLDALLAELPDVSWDETFQRVREELPAFKGIAPVDPPASFTGTLRNYQREGLGWLQFLQRFGLGGCLADDMGLGKTVMVLALLAARRDAVANGERRPSLVVAPRSVVFNWQQEAERFTPGLRVLQYVGGGRSSMRETLIDYDLVLTTYGTLRRDAQALASVAFDYVVLDEAQAIKNASSVSARATRVLDAQHRLALSGTPIENHLGELWSLFEFLNPGLLGGVTAFNRAGAATQLDDEATGLLSKALRPFMLRRTKEQVASDLPARSEQTLYCELERPQRALYNELLAHYRGKLLNGAPASNTFGRSKMQILEALLRLRQAACHPGLVDPRRSVDGSAKLDVLLPRILEAVEEGHKTLVFSQFTSFLSILRNGLDKAKIQYEYLDGKTRDRQSRVERFQQDAECRLFLISLKAGGLGLNLTAAEYVFLLDPWWNPAVEAQAIDRAHRIGQSRHVFAYRLIAKDTVEERVVELQQRKRKLADAILAADGGLIRDLKREDLELLLS